MTKPEALKMVARLALTQAESSRLTASAGAGDFYDAIAIALESVCPEEVEQARLLAALARESERSQLKFRELLKS